MNKKAVPAQENKSPQVRTWNPDSINKGIGLIYYRHEMMKRHFYGKCKNLGARIAIVGAKQSAKMLLEAIMEYGLPFAGVYEHEHLHHEATLRGHPIHSIQDLAKLNPEDVVIIASTAEATDLFDTFMEIQAICPCKTINLKSLLDGYMLFEDLKSPLNMQFDHYTFNRGLHPFPGENPYWHEKHLPIDIKDKVVLELGPFEGHDTVMLMAQNPKKVIALEARPLNYAKIAVLRSLHNWKNHELLLGDMHLFPQLIKDKLDVIFCAGVFYHSAKPWWLLKSCMERADTIVLCGHVASEFSRQPRKTQEVKLESGTYQFEIYPEYGWADGLSGTTSYSLWFTEEDLIQFLDYYGFQYKKYDSHVNSTGLWIYSLVTRKKS